MLSICGKSEDRSFYDEARSNYRYLTQEEGGASIILGQHQ